MFEIQGKNGIAKIFTDMAEEKAIEQVIGLMNEDISENCQIRMMPDIHAGRGCTIGTTIQLPENKADWKVCPNVIGVDIGCCVRMMKIKNENIDLEKLDQVINEFVPSGFSVHSKIKHQKILDKLLSDLSFDLLKTPHIYQSLGTLGSGNHFIEVGKSESGDHWLSIHTGSRNLGKQVAEYHQKKANSLLGDNSFLEEQKHLIELLKSQNRHAEISDELEKLKLSQKRVNPDFAYLSGDSLNNYLNDMRIAQKYAELNRKEIERIICSHMDWEIEDSFDSVHNFIDIENGIIRKGATSAQEKERLVIPLNMKDGVLICEGKGNPDWNYSAPHGAGRLMSRSKAKESISMEEYIDTMKDIHSSSVLQATLDEAPQAYKPSEMIIDAIKDTATIIDVVYPIYNFKGH